MRGKEKGRTKQGETGAVPEHTGPHVSPQVQSMEATPSMSVALTGSPMWMSRKEVGLLNQAGRASVPAAPFPGHMTFGRRLIVPLLVDVFPSKGRKQDYTFATS